MVIFDLFLWPLLALILLPGLLVYFGLHVVERGVIFVDLALAQVAALGVCVALALGAHPGESVLPWVLSIAFTMLGAGLFAWTRFRHPRVPQESIIGIIYVVAAAAATLFLSHTAEGDEALKNLLVGNLLLVTKKEVLRTFGLFAAIALFHWILRSRFLAVTFDEDDAKRRGLSLRTWDFLFYATFGLTVTSFVQIAGVYLVFSYLIVPAVCGALLSSAIRTRLAIGWAVALVAGLSGLVASVKLDSLDLPTGPSIVCTFGLLLVVCAASPFYFIAEISASVSLKAFGVGVFSIRLSFALSGPAPWRAKGTGSISFFFFDIDVDFDITWGDAANTSLPPVTVFPMVKADLEKPENWRALLPSGSNLLVRCASWMLPRMGWCYTRWAFCR